MTGTCPYCKSRLPDHGTCCRVPEDLERMERVRDLLERTRRNDFLQHKIEAYLVEFGHWPSGQGAAP